LLNNKIILVISAHTDDGELGMGGTMSRLSKSGGQMLYWAFSSAAKSLPIGIEKEDIIRENKEALEVLGVREIKLSDYEVRDFPEHRQEILEELVNCGLNFDIVFMPDADLHQDHNVIHWEVRRAFKDKTIIAYEMARNSIDFHPDLFIEIDDDDIERKIAAISKYKSQLIKNGSRYLKRDFLTAQAKFRGGQGGYELAEGFKIIRMAHGLH